jgi:hypothetical protein
MLAASVFKVIRKHHIQLHRKANEIFSRSNRLSFILINGKNEEGKSLLLNQLINGPIDLFPEEPFRTDGGGEGVTKGLQAYGPVKMSEFCTKWNLHFRSPTDIDLFFIDTKWMDDPNGDQLLNQKLVSFLPIVDVQIHIQNSRPRASEYEHIKISMRISTYYDQNPSSVAVVFGKVGIQNQRLVQDPAVFGAAIKKQNQEVKEQMRVANLFNNHKSLVLCNPCCDFLTSHSQFQRCFWKSMTKLAKFISKNVRPQYVFSERRVIFSLLAEIFNVQGNSTNSIDFQIVLQSAANKMTLQAMNF